MKVIVGDSDALIVVDMQKDFMPGGTLAVPDADAIIPAVNKYIRLFSEAGRPLFFTRDWHPESHISFKDNGGPWPKHCVQNTDGAAFADGLELPSDGLFVISKGTSSEFDAYSGFQGTVLESLLRERGVKRIFVCGVATDFCVSSTVMGGINLGFHVCVLLDAVKGVFDSEEAIKSMLLKGAVGVEFLDVGLGR